MATIKRVSARDMFEASLADTKSKAFQGNAWGGRHVAAVKMALASPHGPQSYKWGSPIVYMLWGFCLQADKHYDSYESLIGEDCFLGPVWQDMGQSIIQLLNGETGNLDCGAIDGLVRDILVANGCEGEV